MDDQNKIRVVLYENPERIERIDRLAKHHEVSRSELYRRAMREYLFHHYQYLPKQEATTDDHE